MRGFNRRISDIERKIRDREYDIGPGRDIVSPAGFLNDNVPQAKIFRRGRMAFLSGRMYPQAHASNWITLTLPPELCPPEGYSTMWSIPGGAGTIYTYVYPNPDGTGTLEFEYSEGNFGSVSFDPNASWPIA